MVREFVLEESKAYRFIQFWECLLYRNYFPVTPIGLPYGWLWGKDRNGAQGDDEDGGPSLLQKSHQILTFAPIYSPSGDSEDNELVSRMITNEIAQDIGPDIAGWARFRRISKMITMYPRLTRSFDDREMLLDSGLW
jgi:hypothetical protein